MLPELPRRIECFDISHIQGAGYGSNTTMVSYSCRQHGARVHGSGPVTMASRGTVVVSYTLQNARRVSMISSISPAGGCHYQGRGRFHRPTRAVWDAKQVPAGVYICRIAIDGRDEWAGKIIIGK